MVGKRREHGPPASMTGDGRVYQLATITRLKILPTRREAIRFVKIILSVGG
jgi:hypothetical protein